MMQLHQRVRSQGARAARHRTAEITLTTEEADLSNRMEDEREALEEFHCVVAHRWALDQVSNRRTSEGPRVRLFGADGEVLESDHRPRDEEKEQVVADAMAVAWACMKVHARTGLGLRALVAVDADTVRAVVNKAYARFARVRVILRENFVRVEWIRAIRVPVQMNAADGPSSNLALGGECVAETWRLAEGGLRGPSVEDIRSRHSGGRG